MDDYRRRHLSTSPRAAAPAPADKHDAAAHPPPLALSADRVASAAAGASGAAKGDGGTADHDGGGGNSGGGGGGGGGNGGGGGSGGGEGAGGAGGDTVLSASTSAASAGSASAAASASASSVRRVAASVLFFCASSLGAIFVNKACLTHYNFNFPTSLMLLQAVLTIILLLAAGKLRPGLAPIVPIKTHDYRRLLPSTLFFVSNVMVGLSALSRVNIPMFSAFRRLTVLFVMGAEFLMLHKTHSRPVVFSVCILTLGAFVSALGDVTFTLQGYMLVFINNALTAAYLASIKRVMRELSLDPISLLYYTNVLALPLIASLALCSRDLQTAYAFYHATPAVRDSAWFLPALSFVAVSAFCVNLSTSICTHVTSPLTTSVAGQVKNVLQSVLGFFSWGYVPTTLNVAGLLVALGGQLAFAFYKHRDAKTASAAAAKNGAEGQHHHHHHHHRARQRAFGTKDAGVEREQLLVGAAGGKEAL